MTAIRYVIILVKDIMFFFVVDGFIRENFLLSFHTHTRTQTHEDLIYLASVDKGWVALKSLALVNWLNERNRMERGVVRLGKLWLDSGREIVQAVILLFDSRRK